MAFQNEQRDLSIVFSPNRETRRVKVPANLELDRGEAVEITTAGNGTALDEVGALTDATKLEGYLLHRIDTTNGTAGEADVVYTADWVNRRAVIKDASIAMSDLVKESRARGLPLLDNENEQGVTA